MKTVFFDPYTEEIWKSLLHYAEDLEHRLEQRGDPESSEGGYLIEVQRDENDEEFVNISALWHFESECVHVGKGRTNDPEDFDDPSYFAVNVRKVCPHCEKLDLTCGETSHNVPKIYDLTGYVSLIERCDKCK